MCSGESYRTMEKRDRPQWVLGVTRRVSTGCGNLYVIVNYMDGGIGEVFAKLGKAGGCASCQLEALTKSITFGLRYGVPLKVYTDHLEGIQCPNPNWDSGKQVLSCPDAIAKVLKEVSLEYIE